MATETLLPSGIASQTGWATGAFTDVDEGTAAADGSVMSTSADGEGETITFDIANSALADGDTVTQVDVVIRHGTGGADTDSLLDIELLIGAVSQGTATPPNRTALTTDTVNNAGWNTDWTAAQLDGMQVRFTAAQLGKAVADRWDIDCFDVVITYTPVPTGTDMVRPQPNEPVRTGVQMVMPLGVEAFEVPAAAEPEFIFRTWPAPNEPVRTKPKVVGY